MTAHAAARIERALAMALLHRQSEALQELRATDQVLTTSAVSDASTKELLADVEMARRSVQNNVESLPPPGQWQRPFFASHSRPGRTETPAPAPPEERIVLRGVNFDFDSSGLRPDAAVILGEVAEILRENPRRSVTVAGHTDSIGADTYNQALSERRAMAVKEYLVRAGVPSETLNAVGYGESQPIASNDTAEGRALSRRVELNLD